MFRNNCLKYTCPNKVRYIYGISLNVSVWNKHEGALTVNPCDLLGGKAEKSANHMIFKTGYQSINSH